jgi:hypothetical protein
MASAQVLPRSSGGRSGVVGASHAPHRAGEDQYPGQSRRRRRLPRTVVSRTREHARLPICVSCCRSRSLAPLLWTLGNTPVASRSSVLPSSFFLAPPAVHLFYLLIVFLLSILLFHTVEFRLTRFSNWPGTPPVLCTLQVSLVFCTGPHCKSKCF